MGRKRTIDDAKLLILIDEFFRTECMQGSKKIKLPRLTEYIQKNGFPSFRVETLRRNKIARERIDELNQKVSSPSDLVPVYKSLDIDAFLSNNRTQASLKSALTSLDTYYRDIFEYAENIRERNTTLGKLNEHNLKLLKNQSEEISCLTQQNKVLKKRVSAAEAEQKRLKDIINDYVYPDIANALLAEDGDLIHAETNIISEKLSEKTITSETVIVFPKKATSNNSTIIKLFDDFEEE